MNRIACLLFAVVYRRLLRDDHTGPDDRVRHWKPIQVKGWRTAICDLGARRSVVTLRFWGLR